MTTQMLLAKKGRITNEMRTVAISEGLDVETIREKVENGRVVILKNNLRENSNPVGIGEGLRVKVNANVSADKKAVSLRDELDRARVIEQAGADVLMYLSTDTLIDETRSSLIQAAKIPVGTVPIYQSTKETLDEFNDISKLSKDKLFSDIERQCEDGVDFITVHCGVTRYVVEQLEKQKRLMGIVSKGGSILACWMKTTGYENPLYEYFDELLDLVKEYDVTLSLGSGLRAGCVNDAGDRAQVAETVVLGELVKRAREQGVQTMVEGPGHVSMDKIPSMIKTIKELTSYAPLYVLGPLACDCASGYDHITSAIGGSIAACYGADFLCYTTANEHILAPSNSRHIKEGIVTAKIAAHCADLAKGNIQAVKKNYDISRARIEFDWKTQIEKSIDKCAFDGIDLEHDINSAMMNGPYYSMKLFREHFGK